MDVEVMAQEPERSESRLGASSEDDSDSDGPSDSKQTEWLATGRAKRATAGNRMQSMLANEEPDSDLELLFAEDEDDQGFSDVGEEGDDERLDSSSDDEDENQAKDDLEGEKELERQAKEKKAASRKRKANDAIPAKFRKRVRIDPTTSSATSKTATPSLPAPRPKKKSERLSWLPTAAEMPTRASSRATTRVAKDQLHAQMEEREARRIKQAEHTAKKLAKMEAMKKPPMTQEQRLREAASVEKRNAKSLNRWEEAEKQREELRRAKLAALNQRTLKGPVLTFWSGTREWSDAAAGKYVVMEEKPKKKKVVKDKDKADLPGHTNNLTADMGPETKPLEVGDAAEGSKADVPGSDILLSVTAQTPTLDDDNTEKPILSQILMQPKLEAKALPPSGDLAAPAPSPPTNTITLPSDPKAGSGLAAPAPPPESEALPTSSQHLKPSSVLAAPMMAPPAGHGISHPPPSTNLASPAEQRSSPPVPAQSPKPISGPPEPQLATKDTDEKTASVSEPPLNTQDVESKGTTKTATRSAIVYQNFDSNSIRDKSVQNQILFGRKMTKLSKPQPHPLCVITNHPARYRDPKTGLPYYNSYAYREIQRLRLGNYRWSQVLGAWVGGGKFAARGVPARFLDRDAKGPKQIAEEKELEERALQEQAEANEAGEAPKILVDVKGESETVEVAAEADDAKAAENQAAKVEEEMVDVQMTEVTA